MANGNNGTSGHEQELVDVQDLKATLKKGGNKGLFNEATCSTAAATAAKTVTAPASFSLVSGATIIVTFTNGISVDNATLAVGSTAAKPIYYKGAALEADYVEAGDVIMLRYDGTSYNVVGKLGGRALPEVQIGGSTPSSDSEIKLFVDESADDTVEVYTKAQADGQFVAVVNMNTEPTESTLTYTSTDGTTKNFKVGDEVRVPDAEADNGYTFYKLYALTTEEGVTTATWDKLGAGGGATITGTIITNLEAYVNDAKTAGGELVGVVVTLTNTSDSEVVGTHTIASGETSATFSGLTPMKNYSVSVSSVTGYTQPAAQTISELGIGTTVRKTLQYEADEYTVSISSNQGSGDTAISSATVTIDGTALSDGDTKKVAKGTSISPTASDITNYSKALTTSGKTVSVVYSTELVTVTCTADDSSSVAGQKVTVNGTQYTLDSTGIVTAKVAFGTSYTVVAADWSGYTTPASQSFTANQVSRSVSVEWEEIVLGAFVEATDGTLYTSSNWSGSGKTANSIVVITDSHRFRIYPRLTELTYYDFPGYNSGVPCTIVDNVTAAKQNFDGKSDTQKMVAHFATRGKTDFGANVCNNISFAYGGQQAYMPSAGQLNIIGQNYTQVQSCFTALGITLSFYLDKIPSSTWAPLTSNIYFNIWSLDVNTKEISITTTSTQYNYLVVCDY